MAQPPFGFGSMGVMRPKTPEQTATQPVKTDPAQRRARLEGIATQTQIPANVLMAIEEMGEVDVEGIANRLAAETKSGRKVEEILPPDLMNRAYDIADEIYPRAPAAPPERSRVKEALYGAGEAAVRGVAGAIDATTSLTDSAALTVDANKNSQGLVEGVRSGADWLGTGVSDETRQAAEKTLPTGNPFDLSSWKAPEDVSIDGLIQVAAQGIGSLAPTLVAGVLGGARAAMATGAAMSGGEGLETGRTEIDKLWSQKDAQGVSMLEQQSDVFRDLVASGMPREEAYAQVREAAAKTAGAMQAAIGGLSGAFLGRLVNGGIPKSLAAKTGLGRAGQGVAATAVEEGITEAGEGIAARAGVNQAAGTSLAVGEGAIENAVAGAIGGGPVGALAGFQGGQPQPEGGDGSAVQGPGTGPAVPPPGGAGPVPNSMGIPPGIAAPGQPPAPVAPPAGPISEIAALAPDLTPVPEVEPVEVPPMFPDMKPGVAVRMMDPETGEILEGVFQREEGGNAIVRINGEEQDIDPRFFDEMLGGARQADMQAEAAAKAGKGAKKPAVKTAAPAPVKPVPPTPGEGFVRVGPDQPFTDPFTADIIQPDKAGWYHPYTADFVPDEAQATPAKPADKPATVSPAAAAPQGEAIPPSKPPAAAQKPVKTDALADITPEQAAIRLANVEERIAKAKTPRKDLVDLRDRLKAIVGTPTKEATDEGTGAIAGQAIAPEPAGSADGPVDVAGDRPAAQLPDVDPERGEVTEKGAAPGRTDPAGVEPGRGADDGVDGAADAGKRADALTAAAKPTPAAPKGRDDDRIAVARDNITVDKTLPGRQALGVPMASIQIGKDADGKFMVRSSFNTPTGGFSNPFGGAFDTAEEAEASARDKIVEAAKFRLSDKAKGQGYNDQDAADARKILKWMGVEPDAADPAPVPEPSEKPAKKSEKSTWADFDESSANDPKMPNGYDLTTVKRMTKAEASARGYGWPSYMAVVVRDKPYTYSSASGYSEVSRTEAVTRALKSAQKGVVEPAAQVTPPTPDQGQQPTAQIERVDGPEDFTEAMTRRSGEKAVQMPDGTVYNLTDIGSSDTNVYWGVIVRKDGVIQRVLGEAKQKLSRADALRLALDDAFPASPAAPKPAQVDAAAAEADKNPTDGQKEAGNYKMGHIQWNGLDITIETAKGAMRRGKSNTGKEWSVKMPAHYGYIKRTEGADGDHLDVYIGDAPDSVSVYVFDQYDPETKRFDEHKTVLGVSSLNDAVAIYDAGFSDGSGPTRRKAPVSLTVDQFKAWLATGDLSKPASTLTTDDVQPAPTATAKPQRPEPPLENADHDATAQRISDFIGGFPSLDRIREQARIYGFENLAFEFRRDAGGGRRDSIWVTATGKVLSIGQKSKPKAIRDGVIRDTLSSFTNVPASWKPESLFSPPPKAKPGPKSLGTNARGRPLFEDENGVRSYSDNGVTASEAVSMTPTRDRGYVLGVNKSDRGKDFLTQEEWDAENKAPEPAPANPEGTPGVLVIKSLQTGKTSTVDTRPSQPAPAPAPKPGLLSALSQEKQDRAAELKARLAAKARSQTSSGLDPEYITLGGELVALYIEAGTKKFGQMLRDFAETTGLSLREAQAPMRAAYNHVRDDMDLNGEDITGMDSSEQVMAEVRKALAAEATAKPSQKPAEPANVEQETPAKDAANDETGSDDIGAVGQDGEPQAGGVGNVAAGQSDGDGLDQPLGAPEAGSSVGDEAVRSGATPRPRSGRKGRGAGNGTDPAGDAPVRRPRTGAGGLVDAGRGRDEPAVPGRANYRITDPEALFAGGPKARFRKNREALETFQRVSDEGRDPTPEELDAMAAYIGWGSFGQELFQGTFENRYQVKPEWKDEDSWLRDMLGKEAWQSAQNSIINAHYTDPPTVKAIWAAIEAMGFKGGRVLEPSMGIGNFFGLMPQALEQASQLTGIELDKTTGGMAKMLYPRANVRVMGYEKSTTPDSFYDLVIGNWPFANFSPADRRYNDLNASLHDYFFVKAVDQVRPGGLVVGITSAFSMDGTKNRNVRLHLAKRAELVASFRLPSGAFEKYAGTKVVTDLVIYRKRDAMIMDTTQEAWIKSAPYKTPSGDEINVNQYYIDNPGQVLGTLDYGSGTTYFKSGMIVRRPDNIGELLEGIAKRVPADAYRKPEKRGKETRFVANNTTDRRFSVTVGADGALYQVLGDQMAALEDVVKYRTSNATETKAREDQFRKLVDMRRKVGAVMDADRDGTADAEAKRAELKTAYQAFRKAHGAIKDSYAIGIMRTKLKDPFAGLLLALENTDGTPAAIMDKSTVRAARKMDNPTIRDAFVMSRNESLALDLDRIADMAKTSVEAVTSDLIEAKAIYRVPGGGYQPSDVYLAGNVRQKLAEAREAAAQGEDMAASIAALEAVQPPDIPYFQIEARFGADWLAPDVNRQFLIETMGIEYTNPDDVKLIRSVSGWRVELSDRVARMRGVSDITGAPTPGRRSTGLSLRRFIEATLNTQTINVTEEDGDGGTVKDTKATDQANAKAGELREKFGEWVWKDPERRFEVERSYNEIMNAVATPQIDGSFMEFPGMALTRGTSPFNLRKHQSDAIWKGILNQRGIYGHEVGTGKTITMAGIAVESRRYGLAKKPLLIAHNANSSAVATEAQETYPGAKIMYVDNLSPGEIEAQLGRMRTEDWDMIVIPHSLIDRMSLSEDTLMQMAADDIAAYEAEAIAAAQDEGIELSVEDMDGPSKDLTKKLFSSATAKEMVKARNRLIESIRKQAQRASREGAVAFEDLGIDMILVDESHEFKKPPIATRMAVKGLNKGTSDRSLALRFLTNYVKGQRGGTGVHVFTGTPLTNTLTEIYHQMYYAMDDVMRVNKVDTWDGFFKAFANTISDVEVTATNEYENVERLAAFINVSELRRMAGQYMDIVFADDMPEFKPRTTASGKDMNSKDLTDKERAELLDGRNDDPQGRPYKKVVHDIGPMGADQKRILQETVGYARAFKAAGGKDRREIMQRGGPDAPIVFNGVPNRASMDPRLHEIDAEDDPNSKANRAVKNIARIYNEEPMATQVLFMDEGYSDASVSVKTNKETGEKTKTKKAKFNLVADIVAKLVKEGVKPEEIFIVAGGVTADQKRIIADKMNKREIRVVIGQTRTLGVGVNMQKYLRAMHHLDAPWMPGDLEQRNGRGQRQGNTWNTVYEYRYLTESLDGRRWQVLAIKDRFIKAFLKAKEGLRTIEGDAADDSESMDSSSLGGTLAEAAGDPRLMQSNKLAKRIEKLQSRERIHSQGIADAISKAKKLRATAEREEAELPPRREDATHVKGLREAAAFSATVNGKTYDNRPEADAAIEAYLPKAGLQIRRGMTETLSVEVNGFKVEGQVMQYASMGNVDFRITRQGVYNIGKPSLSSIEGAIRRIPDRLADAEATIEDTKKQAERLDAMAKEPFQQQKDLDQKKADLEKLKQDMQDNPVPAPVWLRQGAPIDTLIFVDGQERVVTGHRWTETGWFVATEQGDVDYAEAKDQFGMPLYDVVPFEAPEVLEGSKAIMGDEAKDDDAEMRDTPAGWGEVEADAPITDDDIRALTRDMNAELATSGLAGKVSVRVVRSLISRVSGGPIQGRFTAKAASIEVRAGAVAGERGVMRHEIIHALRAEALWNKPYGLFTGPEWRELVKAARAEPEIVASVEARYPNLDRPAQVEEMVAELYRLWAEQRDGYDGVAKALAKVEAFLQAMANLLRGKGFVSAARTMEQIAGGKVGGRGPQGPGGRRAETARRNDDAEMRAIPGTVRDKFKGLVGFRNWRDAPQMLSAAIRSATTDRITTKGPSLLALVPGRPLFAELGKSMLSAKRYLRAKEEMDTLRNDWHAKAAETAQKWIDLQNADTAATDAMMDLMHRSTLTGVDPSRPDMWGANDNLLESARNEYARFGPKAQDWAKKKLSDYEKRKKTYATVKAMFDALPPDYQAFYVEVKGSYDALATDFDRALEDNIKAAAKVALKRQERIHRKEERRIKDEGLTGQEKADAIEENDKALAKAKKRALMGVNARIKSLRKTFEGQRLKGPYFPLARFGDYFVTVRDSTGKVENFSRFESEAAQQTFVKEQEALFPGGVKFGLMEDKGAIKDQIPPKFVADVEMMLADTGASPELMDAIWQRYLESLPDQSIRTSKIHRKGREGFSRDALRAYTSHTFHGAHQLARLKYGIELEDSLDDAMDEARRSDDPNRATALVNEMRKRMDWTMNPTGSGWSAAASSLAFVWYLGVSPAAALVNITQTTVIGPAVMKAGIKSATYPKAIAALTRAAKDFGQGHGNTWSDTWTAENTASLSADEKAAMKEGYRRGTIDKTQAHDIAAIADSGIEFSPWREAIMRKIGFFFHHAERVNREVTYLANYRLARADGQGHGDAIETASDLTWKIHFSYQNSDRPRFMQNDYAKTIFIFRQFSTNLLYRLFRDLHQSVQGKSAAEKAEARTQLVGISLSMMAHAGIKGVWGYSLIMGLLSLFFPGDSDDLEEWMQDALLMEGDSMGVAAWNYAMGATLSGVPGQLTGAALTERIGSPNLWFRGSDRDLEGRDLVQHYINEMAGPIGGIAFSVGGAAADLASGEVVRGIEGAVPKFLRDMVRTGRYAAEGVQTRNDDLLIENINPWELILQANGFTPARVAERYDQNTRLRNNEKKILDQRKGLHREAGDYVRKGEAIPEGVMEKIRKFNSEVPEYPITGDTLRQSIQGRERASQRNEYGVSLNPKLNDRLRDGLAPAIYN